MPDTSLLESALIFLAGILTGGLFGAVVALFIQGAAALGQSEAP